MPSKIFVKGARENNLKNIDVEIPRDALTVITGLSGSGKSSLAFDTIYAEGQRRYVESLSSYVCLFFGLLVLFVVFYFFGFSLGRRKSPTSTISKAFPPPFPSTRRPPRRIHDPPSAR